MAKFLILSGAGTPVPPPTDGDYTGDFWTNDEGTFFGSTVVNFGLSPYTAIFSDAHYNGFNSPYTVSSKTFPTGYALLYLFNGTAGMGAGHQVVSVSILGHAATLLAEVTDHSGQWWGAAVTAGTGDIVVTGDGFSSFGMIGTIGGILLGMNNTPTAHSVNGPSNYPQPFVTTITVPTNGVAISGVGGQTFVNVNPTAWSIGSMRRDAVAEAYTSDQNTCSMAGAHTYVDGVNIPISSTGGGVNGWGWNGSVMVTLAFGP